MAFNLYSLSHPILFSIDAEKSHDLTISLLKKTQHNFLSHFYHYPLVNDPITLAGLNFPNKVGLAAGLDKNAACIDAFFNIGFGFVEVGTVTPLAQLGNPKPRLFRLPSKQALINRFGFNNEGLNAFINNVKKSKLAGNKQLLGLNIGKNAVTAIEHATEDYLIALRGVYPYADYITINISSPNTKNLRSLQDDVALNELLKALAQEKLLLKQQHNKTVPLFVKIAPDLTEEQIKSIAEILQKNQIDGVIATNTTLSRTAVTGLKNSEQTGGLSGAPVREMSNKVIYKLRQCLGKDFPIIGVGGIITPLDAVEKIQAGADLVQIYTGLIYRGPSLASTAAKEIKNSY